jgi:hypothetical protein
MIIANPDEHHGVAQLLDCFLRCASYDDAPRSRMICDKMLFLLGNAPSHGCKETVRR